MKYFNTLTINKKEVTCKIVYNDFSIVSTCTEKVRNELVIKFIIIINLITAKQKITNI